MNLPLWLAAVAVPTLMRHWVKVPCMKANEATETSAIDVEVSEHILRVSFSDGRIIPGPIESYPRLVYAASQWLAVRSEC